MTTQRWSRNKPRAAPPQQERSTDTPPCWLIRADRTQQLMGSTLQTLWGPSGGGHSFHRSLQPQWYQPDNSTSANRHFHPQDFVPNEVSVFRQRLKVRGWWCALFLTPSHTCERSTDARYTLKLLNSTLSVSLKCIWFLNLLEHDYRMFNKISYIVNCKKSRAIFHHNKSSKNTCSVSGLKQLQCLLLPTEPYMSWNQMCNLPCVVPEVGPSLKSLSSSQSQVSSQDRELSSQVLKLWISSPFECFFKKTMLELYVKCK